VDAARVGDRIHGRLLLDEAGGIVVVGDSPALPGGPLGPSSSLVGAVRVAAERQVGSLVAVGAPLLVTLDETDGLVVVFGGTRLDDIGTAPAAARSAAEADRPDAVEARRAGIAGRTRYRETLWWPAGPRTGTAGRLAPSLGELLGDWADADITLWALGVALGVFPSTTTFAAVKGMFWSTRHPHADTATALERVMTALVDAGVVDEDGGGAEFRWADRLDVVAG
jgi:hypothetical protein